MPEQISSVRLNSRPVLLVLASTYPRWAGDPEPGFVHELARRLTDRFDVMVLCPHAPGARRREKLDGVEVHRYRYAPERWETLVHDGGVVTNLRRNMWKYLLVPGFVFAQAWRAWWLVYSGRVDVIHAHWLIPQGLIAALLQLFPGRKIPFLVTSHGADLFALKGKLMGRLKRLVLSRAGAATVVSSAMRNHLGQLGGDTANISVLPMGVDLTGRFTPDKQAVRSRWDILFVGRLVEKKGLRYLLDALPEILRQIPDVRLDIAGFGPERDALEQQTARLGVSHAVRFLGPVPQESLPDLYRRAALFVAPFVEAGSGDQEGLGLVVVEAIGCGCPVVVGDVPAVRDVLGNDSSLCVDVRKTFELASAVLRVLNQPQSAAHHAVHLRKALVEKLDWNQVANGYARVLADCRVHGVAEASS